MISATVVAPRLWNHADFRPILLALRPALVMLVLTSALMNILLLTGPLFMLQVYDRVLSSRSMSTLVGLLVLAAVMTGFLGLIEVLRARVLTRLGVLIDEALSGRVFSLLLQREQRSGPRGAADQCVRDLDTVRSFAAGAALSACFDVPWIFVYVTVCFLFHPLMGWAVLGGVVALCALAMVTEAALRGPTERAFTSINSRRSFADTMKRNAGLLQALGMQETVGEKWCSLSRECRDEQTRSSDVASLFGSIMRSFRMLLQSLLLAVGAYLVIHQEATGGIMLAATILTVRALSPVELLIANWKSTIAARQSLTRLSDQLSRLPVQAERTPLPAPSRSISVSALSLLASGRDVPIVHAISFSLMAGSALGIIGPSGSGKSSLARALVGLWPPTRGVIRLDGAEIDQWSTDTLGRSIGYLPQDVELLPGTIAQNIARFRTDDPNRIFAAADQADVHEMILRLPDGYETQVGEGGMLLSGGQRQRIALARALYDDPFLLVLDEPNSNLDAQGEAALTRAVQSVRVRGGIVIVVAHRPSALAAVDKLLVINNGVAVAFGERDAVLKQITMQPAERRAAAPPSQTSASAQPPREMCHVAAE